MFEYGLIIAGITLGLIICNIFARKKVAIFGLILIAIYYTQFIIKIVDAEYYQSILDKIPQLNDKLDLYLLIYASVSFVIAFVEVLSINYHQNKKEQEALNINNSMYEDRIGKIESLSQQDLNNRADIIKDYFEMLKEPVAYLNDLTNTYVLNSYFRNLLGINKSELPFEDLVGYVTKSDIDSFKSRTVSERYFRLVTVNGNEWFKIVGMNRDGKNIEVIKKTDERVASSISIGNFKDLDRKVNEYISSSDGYGIILSHIISVKEYVKGKYEEIDDNGLKDIIIAKYLVNITNGFLKDQVNIYRIGNLEYGLIIQNKKYFDMVEHELNLNNSDLNIYDGEYNGIKFMVKAKLGLALSQNVKENQGYKTINAAFDMLQMAMSKNYSQDFAVYQFIQDQNPSYDLNEMGIDLENDLNEFKK